MTSKSGSPSGILSKAPYPEVEQMDTYLGAYILTGYGPPNAASVESESQPHSILTDTIIPRHVHIPR